MRLWSVCVLSLLSYLSVITRDQISGRGDGDEEELKCIIRRVVWVDGCFVIKVCLITKRSVSFEASLLRLSWRCDDSRLGARDIS